jgi:hypothetical protein
MIAAGRGSGAQVQLRAWRCRLFAEMPQSVFEKIGVFASARNR